MPRAVSEADFPTHFWSRITQQEGCWEWQGATVSGYGCYRSKGKTRYAHRTAYELAVGPLNAGDCVLHRCDNRLCCRPDHLFIGDRADNIRDAADKDRTRFGTARPQAKLTDDDVRHIRSLYSSGRYSQQALAGLFGVAQMTVSNVVTRKTWRRVV